MRFILFVCCACVAIGAIRSTIGFEMLRNKAIRSICTSLPRHADYQEVAHLDEQGEAAKIKRCIVAYCRSAVEGSRTTSDRSDVLETDAWKAEAESVPFPHPSDDPSDDPEESLRKWITSLSELDQGFKEACPTKSDGGNTTTITTTASNGVEPPVWTQLGGDIDGEAAGEFSGNSVSLSSDGTTVAIGAKWAAGNGALSGHVKVWRIEGSTWTQVGENIDGEAEGDSSGYSVSLSSDGTTVAIGAPSNDENGVGSGHVTVWRIDGSTWTQVGEDIDGEAANDFSGNSVSLSSDGTTVAIGAIYAAGNGAWSGHVRVWRFEGSTWTQVGEDIDGESAGDWSGFSVSVSSDGSTVAISATQNGFSVGSGHVRVFRYRRK